MQPVSTHLLLQVLDYDLQRQLTPYMRDMVPMPGIFDPKFIAANQAERADNVIPGTKAEQVATVREQLASYKKEHGLDKMVVLWTANTERYAEVKEGLNDTAGARPLSVHPLRLCPSVATGKTENQQRTQVRRQADPRSRVGQTPLPSCSG